MLAINYSLLITITIIPSLAFAQQRSVKFNFTTLGEGCFSSAQIRFQRTVVAAARNVNNYKSIVQNKTRYNSLTDAGIYVAALDDLEDNNLVSFTWSSNLVTDKPCCWTVSNFSFLDNGYWTREDSICNTGDIGAHNYNGVVWICTLRATEQPESPRRISLAIHNSYILTNGKLSKYNRTTCTTVSSTVPQAQFKSLMKFFTSPSTHTMKRQIPGLPLPDILPTSIIPTIPPVIPPIIPSLIPPIIPSILPRLCLQDGIWLPTLVGLNITVNGACFDGSTTGTRRCGNNSRWDDPFCIVPMEFTDVLSEILESAEEGLMNLGDMITSDNNNLSVGQSLFLLDTVVEDQLDGLVSDEVTQVVLRVAVELIEVLQLGTDLIIEIQRTLAAQLLRTLDFFALTSVEPSSNALIVEPISLMVIELPDMASNEMNISFIFGRNFIIIPADLCEEIPAVRIAAFLYENVSDLLPPRDNESSIVSPIISVAVNDSTCSVDNLSSNVTIQLIIEVLPNVNESVFCVFFQYPNNTIDYDDTFDYDDTNGSRLIDATGDWSTRGCTTTSVDGDIVTCSCNHLTHFAILLSPAEVQPESQAQFEVLNTIGRSLVPISLLCMVLVILTYACIR